MIITEWVFMMFMNGWILEVEKFPTQESCQDKVKTYNLAAKQSDSKFKVWCEKQTTKKSPMAFVANIREIQ